MKSNATVILMIIVLILGAGWLYVQYSSIPVTQSNPPPVTVDADSGDLLDDYFGPQDTADGTLPGADPSLVDWNAANNTDEITDLSKRGMDDLTSLGKYALLSQAEVVKSSYVAMTSIAMSADVSQTIIASAPWFGLFGLGLVIYLLSRGKSKDSSGSQNGSNNTKP